MYIKGWMDKEDRRLYISLYYLAMRKNKVLPFVTTQMSLENSKLSALSEKDKYCMSSLTCET